MKPTRYRIGTLAHPISLDVVMAHDYTDYRCRARSNAWETNDVNIEQAWWGLGMRHLARLTVAEYRRLRPYNAVSYYQDEARVTRLTAARAATIDERTRYERVVLGRCDGIGAHLLAWPVGTYDGATPAIPLLVEIVGPLDGYYVAEETYGVAIPSALPGPGLAKNDVAFLLARSPR